MGSAARRADGRQATKKPQVRYTCDRGQFPLSKKKMETIQITGQIPSQDAACADVQVSYVLQPSDILLSATAAAAPNDRATNQFIRQLTTLSSLAQMSGVSQYLISC
jgi:hypothetical protein